MERAARRYRTALVGGAKRSRTADLLNAIQALYQLSYTPIIGEIKLVPSIPSVNPPLWDADDLTDSPTAYFLVRLRVLNCWGVRYPIDECFRSNR